MTQPNPPDTTERRTEPAPSRNGANLRERVRSLRLNESTQGGGSRGSAIPWVLCGVLFLVAAAASYRAYRVTPAAETPAPETDRAPSTSVGTTGSAASSGDVALEVKGHVRALHQIQVSPKVGGQLKWLHPRFEEGAAFQEGDVLARIEDVEYRADYERAKGAYLAAAHRYEELKNGSRPQEKDQAKADLDEHKANLEQLRLELKRTTHLSTTSSAAARDYEVAKYGFDAMERRVARMQASYELMLEGPREERKLAARAEMEQAKADLIKAEWRLQNTEIVAPVTGTVLTKKAELGNLVNPSAFSNGLSASLCDMADLAELEIHVLVQERSVANIFKGQKCTVMPEAFQRHEPFLKKYPNGYEGEVSRLMPIADQAQSAIPVRVRVKIPSEEAGVYLKPDMGAQVSFKKAK